MKRFRYYVEETITRRAIYTVDAVDEDAAAEKVLRRDVVSVEEQGLVARGVRIITDIPYQPIEEKKNA